MNRDDKEIHMEELRTSDEMILPLLKGGIPVDTKSHHPHGFGPGRKIAKKDLDAYAGNIMVEDLMKPDRYT